MKCLVIYNFGCGVGNVDVTFRNFPPTMKDIRDAEEEIKKINNFKRCPTILNWLEISEDNNLAI